MTSVRSMSAIDFEDHLRYDKSYSSTAPTSVVNEMTHRPKGLDVSDAPAQGQSKHDLRPGGVPVSAFTTAPPMVHRAASDTRPTPTPPVSKAS